MSALKIKNLFLGKCSEILMSPMTTALLDHTVKFSSMEKAQLCTSCPVFFSPFFLVWYVYMTLLASAYIRWISVPSAEVTMYRKIKCSFLYFAHPWFDIRDAFKSLWDLLDFWCPLLAGLSGRSWTLKVVVALDYCDDECCGKKNSSPQM